MDNEQNNGKYILRCNVIFPLAVPRKCESSVA